MGEKVSISPEHRQPRSDHLDRSFPPLEQSREDDRAMHEKTCQRVGSLKVALRARCDRIRYVRQHQSVAARQRIGALNPRSSQRYGAVPKFHSVQPSSAYEPEDTNSVRGQSARGHGFWDRGAPSGTREPGSIPVPPRGAVVEADPGPVEEIPLPSSVPTNNSMTARFEIREEPGFVSQGFSRGPQDGLVFVELLTQV